MPNKSFEPFKRGNTFVLRGVWRVGGVPAVVSPGMIRSQIRTSSLRLVEELTVQLADQMTDTGRGVFWLVSGSTSAWPVGLLIGDIVVTQGAAVRSTETFEVPVVAGATAP